MPTRSSLGLLAAFATLCAAFSAPLTRVCASSAARGAARARTVVAEDEVGDWGVDNLMDLMGEADEKIGSVESFISTVKGSPKTVEFEMTMAAIEDGFDYEPVSFTCGELSSAKVRHSSKTRFPTDDLDAGPNLAPAPLAAGPKPGLRKDLQLRQAAEAHQGPDSEPVRPLLPRGRAGEPGWNRPRQHPELHQERLGRG